MFVAKLKESGEVYHFTDYSDALESFRITWSAIGRVDCKFEFTESGYVVTLNGNHDLTLGTIREVKALERPTHF
jgi:hypothetical protein